MKMRSSSAAVVWLKCRLFSGHQVGAYDHFTCLFHMYGCSSAKFCL
jgi:hypothetical protein